jgi:hypothetical protein
MEEVGKRNLSRSVRRALVEKFGEDHRCYMERVPGLNPVTGILRL